MLNRPGLDFSFSGLKTAAITELRANPDLASEDLAASFEAAVVDTLLAKCKRALQQEQLSTLVISGGVGANKQLREQADKMCETLGGRAFYPRLEFCTDNGAMIALVGALRLEKAEQSALDITIRPRWSLDELNDAP